MIELSEAAVFTQLDRVAVTFACEVVTEATQTEPSSGFRLTHIYRTLFGPRGDAKAPDGSAGSLDRARKLFAASRSFLDDITTGPPGVNGRPLLLAAQLDENGQNARAATIVRPEFWAYDFESTSVRLATPEIQRAIPVQCTDYFCVFESGRIFYLATFGQKPEHRPRLDEYGLIQLERLTFEPAGAADWRYLGFREAEARAGSDPFSLHDFLAERLARLAVPEGEAPNALRDVLRHFGIVPMNESLQLTRQGWLRNGLVQIEDETLFDTAQFAHRFFAMDDGPGDGGNKPTKTPVPKTLAKATTAWKAALAKLPSKPHAAEHIDDDGPAARDDRSAAKIERPVLAFAGLAQGVPDFPRQDHSEIHDSTRPASAAPEGMFYVHPAFELAAGINWRTFRDAQQEVGGCPYAIMAWIIGLHDEVIVTDMEQRIDRMIYREPDENGPAAKLGPAKPAEDLIDVLSKAASTWRTRNAMIGANLKSRLDIFRWCSIHRSGNVFRYSTERELLAAIHRCRGTDARFDDAHDTLDRYESLVEDLSSLTANYAAMRANWLLGAIAVLGLIGLPTAVAGTLTLLGAPLDPGWATLGIVGVALALFLAWNWTQKTP